MRMAFEIDLLTPDTFSSHEPDTEFIPLRLLL